MAIDIECIYCKQWIPNWLMGEHQDTKHIWQDDYKSPFNHKERMNLWKRSGAYKERFHCYDSQGGVTYTSSNSTFKKHTS